MSITKCPHCGQSVQLTKVNTPGIGWQHIQRFESAVPAIAPAQSQPQFSEAERRAPARPASVESDVLVPGAQALATGVAVCVVAIPASIYFGWHWTTPLTALAVTTAGTWLTLLGAHRKLLWTVETIINRDIDGDGATGKPEPARTVRVEVQHKRTTEIDDLPGPPDALRDFAAGILNQRYSFSERGAARAGYGATAFRQLRSTFVARGWAQWRNPDAPQQGIDLRRKGAAVLKQLAEQGADNV